MQPRVPSRSKQGRRGTGARAFRPSFRRFGLLIFGGAVVTFILPFFLGPSTLPAWLFGRSPWVPTWTPSRQFCVRPRPPLVCAHGGDSSNYPANTLAAITAVSGTNARCIEIDASPTADGELVALHGRDLATILGQNSASVADYTLAQLEALKVEGGQSILTVKKALHAALAIGLDLITLDLKPGPPLEEDRFVEKLLSVVAEAGCGEVCQTWAKDDSMVEAVNAARSPMRTGYVVMNQTADARAERLDVVVRMPQSPVAAVYYGMVDLDLMAETRAGNKEVHTWTVNDPDAMKQVLDAGVDAVITNHPREIQGAIESLQLQCLSESHHVGDEFLQH